MISLPEILLYEKAWAITARELISKEPIMPASRDDLYAFFKANDIVYNTVEHPPIFTVADGADIKAALPGAKTKNLFLKDKSGHLFLICAAAESQIGLNRLHQVLGCKRLSFANEDLLLAHLGVTPGSVTLFSLINDDTRNVTLILDAALLRAKQINFHPLKNTATTGISKEHMLRFITALNRVPIAVDFSDFKQPVLQSL